MLRRPTRMLAAVAAGVTVFGLGGAAAQAGSMTGATGTAVAKLPAGGPGVQGGPAVYSPPQCGQHASTSGGCAGYVASGRNFRFAQAQITVPDGSGDSEDRTPVRYITLASNFDLAAAGIMSCALAHSLVGSFSCSGGAHYAAFEEVYHNGFLSSARVLPIGAVNPAQGVFFSIYQTVTGNELEFTVTLPDGASYYHAHAADGAIYTEAAALSNWMTSTPDLPRMDTQSAAFSRGRFTTVSGAHGTFSGPWSLTPYDVTSNGSAPPMGTAVAGPTSLGADDSSYHGLWGDTFSIWLYHS